MKGNAYRLTYDAQSEGKMITPYHFWFRIHTETTSVLLRQLPVEALKRPTNWKYAPPSAGKKKKKKKIILN